MTAPRESRGARERSGSGDPRRTLAPFGRRLAEVVANADAGRYRLLSVLDPRRGALPRAGQFYMLAAEARWGGGEDERPYLGRAFSHCRAHADGRLDFLIDAVGPGTGRLAELAPRERVRLVGPLGRGFDAAAGRRHLLVGGGIGVAPLVALFDELGADGDLMLGFRSASYADAAALFAPAVAAIATDDGSAGRHALVTELLRERLDEGGDAAVYACGPPAMLEAVRAQCAARRIPAQLALESGMACGFGACFGCVVPTRNGYVRLCVDGPVLDASVLEEVA
jgi:dihydroorotate dehydrogenase electron transfer subunit